MDGSYSNPIGRGGQNLTSSATPSNAYQVNVNRSKTKKWVEAKTQNYDGDDWGSEEYDDEDDEDDEDEPVPQLQSESKAEPPVPRAAPTQLPSATRVPSGSASPPPLHIQTQQAPAQTAAGGSQSRPAAETSSPAVSRLSTIASPSEQSASEHLVSPQSAGTFRGQDVPRSGSPRLMTPTSRLATYQAGDTRRSTDSSEQNRPLVRPSDIYRRMEEEKERKRVSSDSARPSLDATGQTASPPQASTAADTQQSQPQQHLESEVGRERISTSPQLPDVARMSGFGFDMFASGPQNTNPAAGSSTVREKVEEEDEQEQGTSEPAPSALADHAAKIKTESDGPTTQARQSLPSQASLSPPPQSSADIAGNAATTGAGAASLPSTEASESTGQRRPTLPGGYVTEDPSHAGEAASTVGQLEPQEKRDAPDVSPVSDRDDDGSRTSKEAADTTRRDGASEPTTTTHKPGLDPANDARSLPPLRTPSPHGSQTIPLATAPAHQSTPREEKVTSPQTVTSDITPVEPLQPRKPEQSPFDYEPEPLERAPTFDTVKSSPVKESDMLSDEIIKSLSPGGPASATPKPGDNRKSTFPAGRTGRESSYTLSGYDDYWADTTGKPGSQGASRSASASSKNTGQNPVADETPVPPLPSSVQQPTQPAPAGPTSPETSMPSAVSRASSDGGRKRFSWEMESDPSPPAAPTDEPPNKSEPAPAAAPAIVSPTIAVNDSVSVHSQSSKAGQSPSVPASGSSTAQHRVSSSSPAKPGQGQTMLPEPPSPVSLMSDRNVTGAQGPGRTALADEVSPSPMTSNPVSPTPQPEGHTALSPQSPAGSSQARASASATAQTPNFKDIMGLPSPSQRIAKYKDTRDVFGTMDNGLENWLVTLKTQHPEHANATSSYNAADPLGPPGPTAAGGQQYLNATSPTSAQPGGRSRLGGLPVPSQAGAGAFGHSSQQIGTKGKEFMHSAGKVGKGLLSKGRSKLRGTGDKGESTPPSVQPKLKATERRTSWGLSLGSRSRADVPDPHAIKEVGTGPVANATATATVADPSTTPSPSPSPTPPPQLPQLPQATRLSPFDSGSLDEASQWASPEAARDTTNEPNGVQSRLSLETPDPRGRAIAAQSEKTGSVPADQAADDWVLVPRQSEDQAQTAAHAAGQPTQQPPQAVAQDSGVGLSQTSEPKRNSSFIGLPPIRRGSTFGLTAGKAPRASERFPLNDDETDDDKTEVGIGTNTNEKAAPRLAGSNKPLPPVDSLAKETGDYDQVPSQTGESSLGAASMSQQDTLQGHPSLEQSGQFGTQRPLQPFAGQPGVPGMQPQSMANPIQRLPPSGPWTLEESQLSPPPNVVVRNRAGVGTSHQPFFGYDKETGVSNMTPASPTSPVAGPPPRQRNSEVPPSSAQRYPELFHQQPGPQRIRAGSGAGQPYPIQYPVSPTRDDVVNPRAQSNEYGIPGVGPPAEERGRSRRGSGVFKDIGDRIARAASRERRSSIAEPRPAPAEMRPDDVSVSSIGTEDVQERKKKRSSFLGLRGRPSVDQVSQISQRDSTSTLPPDQDVAQAPDAAQAQKDRKRSLLGVVSNFSTSKLVPGGLPRSSTSSLANEQSAEGKGDGDEPGKPAKRRFSGMPKMSAITGAIQRLGHDQGQDQGSAPGTSHSTASGTSSQKQQGAAGAMGPPEAPAFRRTRSGTAESMVIPPTEMAPPNAPATEPEGRRSRRGSAVGLLSGLKEKVAGMKPQEQQQAWSAPAPEQTRPVQTQVHMQQQMPAQQQVPVQQQGIPQQQVSGAGPLPNRWPLQSQEQEAQSPVDGGRHLNQIVNNHLSSHSQQSRPSPLGQEAPLTQGDSPTDPNLGLPIQLPPARSQPAAGIRHNRAPSEPIQPPLASAEDISRPLTVSPVPSTGRDEKPEQPSAAAQQGEQHRPSPTRITTEERNKPLPPVDPAAASESQASPAKTQTPSLGPRPSPNAEQTSGQSTPPSAQQPTFYGHSRPIGQTYSQGYRPSGAVGQQPHVQRKATASTQASGFRPSPHTSVDMARSSTQLSGTPGPQSQSGAVAYQTPSGPPTQPSAPPAQPEGQAQGQGSRWKGLKNRMSEQMAQISVPSPGKTEKTEKADKAEKGDRMSATKLLGALKRNSKQGEAPQGQGPTQPVQDMAQQPYGQQSVQQGQYGQHPAPQGHYAAQNMPQGVYAQQQGWRPPPGVGVRQGEAQGRAPYAQYQHQRYGQVPQISSPASAQHQFQVMQPGDHSGVQQQQQQPPGQWRQSQQSPTPHAYGQWPQGQPGSSAAPTQRIQRPPEPQYDQVPIPRGYNTVHSEGAMASSPYYVDRQVSVGQYYPQQQQQQYMAQQSPQSQGHVSPPMQGMLQQHGRPADVDRRMSGGAGYVHNQTGFIAQPSSSNISSVGSPPGRPDATRGPSDVSYNSALSGTHTGQSVTSPQPSQHELLRPQPSDGTAQRYSSEDSQGSRSAPGGTPQLAPAAQAGVTNGAGSGNRGADAPPQGGTATPERKSRNLGVDVERSRQDEDEDEDLYGATPRLRRDGPTGKSEVSQSTTEGDSGSGGGGVGAEARAEERKWPELEDTHEAHKRKQRLASQEEKILYDPEDDVDHVPQMSATSYPGQEWNPYGEVEYGDWRED